MFTRHSNFRQPPNSPHAGINLSQPQSATPSGVSQYELQSVFVPRLQNSSDNTKEGNLLKPIRTSHDLAHSSGLPKPPGYNLEWPRVTPIQVALITRPQTKHHIKTSIKSYVEPSTQSKSAHGIVWRLHRIVGRNWALDHLASIPHHQAPSAFQCSCQPNSAWRNHPFHQAPHESSGLCHYFGSLPLGGLSHVARCHSSSAILLVFRTLEHVLMNLKHVTHNSYYQSTHPDIIIWLNHNPYINYQHFTNENHAFPQLVMNSP